MSRRLAKAARCVHSFTSTRGAPPPQIIGDGSRGPPSRYGSPQGLGPYSLSGCSLDGTKIVRLVYMDEAGISKQAQEPFLVVAGVLVDADRVLNGVENQLEGIMRRHIPAEHQDGFVFHATELFNGGGKVFRREASDFVGPREWPLDRRLKIADEIMAIPRKFNLPIAIGFVERATFPRAFNLSESFPESE